MPTILQILRSPLPSPSFPLDEPRAFLVPIAAMLVQATAFGILNSFSVFLDSMKDDTTLGRPTQTEISFGSSVAVGLSPAIGVLAGALCDRYGASVLCFLAFVSLSAGLLLASFFANSATALVLLYGLGAAGGSGWMLSPGAAASSSWFSDRRRALATGIAFAGGGLGSMIVPPVAGLWSTAYGWRGAFQCMAGCCVVGAVASCWVVIRTPTIHHNPKDDEEEGEDDDSHNNGVQDNAIRSHNNNTNSNNKEGDENETKREGETACGGAHDGGDGDVATPFCISSSSSAVAAASTNHHHHSNDGDDTDPLDAVSNSPSSSSSHFDHAMAYSFLDLVRHVYLSRRFLAHFVSFFCFSFTFYGFLYLSVLFPAAMGDPSRGRAYAAVRPRISNEDATTLMTPFGVAQVVSSIVFGVLALKVGSLIVHVTCCGVTALALALSCLARSYASFAVLWVIVGVGTSGVFAVVPAMVAADFYGPRVGSIIGTVFLAACASGLMSGPILSAMQDAQDGDYSGPCLLMSMLTSVAGMVSYGWLR